MSTSSSSQHSKLISQAKQFIPPLSSKLHKGQAGRVGVVGGSADYCGAPYFSSMASMRIGADLAHVICQPKPGATIKAYSPDLIVHTILDPDSPPSKEDLAGIISRLHALVIGPGLGRDEFMQKWGKECLSVAKEMGKWVVLDADGLWAVTNEPEIIKGYEKAILTPNIMEFKRLCEKLNIEADGDPASLCPRLAAALGNVTIVQKGASDIISNGNSIPFIETKAKVLINETTGGLKRCGGQGDILSGAMGVMAAWAGMWAEGDYNDVTLTPPPKDQQVAPLALLAAYGASTITRNASRLAFGKEGRSMQTSDVMLEVGRSFEEIMGSGSDGVEEVADGIQELGRKDAML